MSTLTGKLLPNKVLIEPLFEDRKTSSGIIIGTTNDVETNLGIVVLIGNVAHGVQPLVNLGDKVMFDSRSSKELEIEGKTYYLVFTTEIQYIY